MVHCETAKFSSQLHPVELSMKSPAGPMELLNNLNALAGKLSPPHSGQADAPIKTPFALNKSVASAKAARSILENKFGPFPVQVKKSCVSSSSEHRVSDNGAFIGRDVNTCGTSPLRRHDLVPMSDGMLLKEEEQNGSAISVINNSSSPSVLTSMNGTICIGTGNGPGNLDDQPDPDAIKMFVGQIPRSMDENDLKEMFEEFGPVYQINILRNKVTRQSKGCCFVTFYTRKSALDAQNELHNIKKLEGMHHPIQMKPADAENLSERKLFVGMLSKKLNEDDVRMMFGQFGAIEDCSVLRDLKGVSKGCAFVKFTHRQHAINAIKLMHHSQTMEECSSPLVVKVADTPKEKDQKRQQLQHQQQQNSILNLTNIKMDAINSQYLALLQQIQSNNNRNSQSGSSLSPLSNLPQLSGVNLLTLQHLLSSSHNSSALPNSGLSNFQSFPTAANLNLSNGSSTPGYTNIDLSTQSLQNLSALSGFALNPMSLQNLATLASLTGNVNSGLQLSPPATSLSHGSPPTIASVGLGSLSPVSTLGIPGGSLNGAAFQMPNTSLSSSHQGHHHSHATVGAASAGSSFIDCLTAANYPGMHQLAGFQSLPNLNQNNHPTPGINNHGIGRQIEGPEGANLFIYHVPQEFTDSDLAQTFMPFGMVISAKVFIDKQTNLSKCFGFVSYDNAASGKSAIEAMNGFPIGSKVLKVQLKRSKTEHHPKPY